MPYVIDFASHAFDKLELDAPTVGELASALDAHTGGPLVITIRSAIRSFLAHPGHFHHVRAQASWVADGVRHGLDDAVDVVGSGLLDALAHGQPNVEEWASPASVALLLRETNGIVAIVVHDGQPTGVFDPSVLAEGIPNASILTELHRGDEVMALAGDGDVIAALRLAEENFSTFHSEGINHVGPRPLQCEADRGHYVGRCPCPKPAHAGARCTRS